MRYEKPELELIGSAENVVLGPFGQPRTTMARPTSTLASATRAVVNFERCWLGGCHAVWRRVSEPRLRARSRVAVSL